MTLAPQELRSGYPHLCASPPRGSGGRRLARRRSRSTHRTAQVWHLWQHFVNSHPPHSTMGCYMKSVEKRAIDNTKIQYFQ